MEIVNIKYIGKKESAKAMRDTVYRNNGIRPRVLTREGMRRNCPT